MVDGFYLSVYVYINKLMHLTGKYLRHDQNISLWKKEGEHIELIGYLELERLTGVKHADFSFYSKEDVVQLINEFLSNWDLTIEDMREIWGTPEFHKEMNAEEDGVDYHSINDYKDFAYHSIAHLFSGLLWDSEIFYKDKILGMAVDAGPDAVMDFRSIKKNLYSGCLSDKGAVTVLPVSSPACLWALSSKVFNLKEGTLMALASASTSKAYIEEKAVLHLETTKDMSNLTEYFFDLKKRIDSLTAEDIDIRFNGFDERFSENENRISMVMKEIQRMSDAIMASNVEKMIKEFQIDPREYYLSLSGGFALNCPSTSYIMKRFGFKGYVAPPCVNDSGLSLGIALYGFYKRNPGISLKIQLKHPYYGKRDNGLNSVTESGTYKPYIDSIHEFNKKQAVEDVIKGPVVWFDTNSEIGPRALGNRSILGDPRNPETKNELNRIKQRQWWRPVAPIVLEEDAYAYFENCSSSPFMLRTYRILEEKLDTIPAVSHLNETARVQTLNSDTNHMLYSFILEFKGQTGVPLLCNTSLNDRGEPIIDKIEEAFNFALRKRMDIMYVNGYRIQLKNQKDYPIKAPLNRQTKYSSKFSEEQKEELYKKLNPYGIPVDCLFYYYYMGLNYILDLNNEIEADLIVRKSQSAMKRERLDIFL